MKVRVSGDDEAHAPVVLNVYTYVDDEAYASVGDEAYACNV